MKILSGLLSVLLLCACAQKTPEGSFVQNEAGVVVTPASGTAKRVRLEVRSDRIVRVTAVADENLELPASLVVVGAKPPVVAFKVQREGDDLALSTVRDDCARFTGERRGEFHGSQWQGLCWKKRRRACSTRASRNDSTPGHRRGVLRSGATPERADEPQRRGRRDRPAQHGHRRAIRRVEPQLRRVVGQLSITRFGNPKPYGLASRDLEIRDAAGKEGGFTARYSIDGAAQARARREGHQLPVHPRPLHLAEGTAGNEDTEHRDRRPTSFRTRP